MGLGGGPGFGSQSSLVRDSLGPVGWTPAVLLELSGKPSGRVWKGHRTGYVVLVHATDRALSVCLGVCWCMKRCIATSSGIFFRSECLL